VERGSSRAFHRGTKSFSISKRLQPYPAATETLTRNASEAVKKLGFRKILFCKFLISKVDFFEFSEFLNFFTASQSWVAFTPSP
jgi:hypothetical protein